MNWSSRAHSVAYRAGSTAILLLVRTRWLARPLSWIAKVWLRHARLVAHLRRARYDQVVDGGANVGEFAAVVRAARPDLPLLCVEPHPEAAAVLRKRGFEVVEAALWSSRGMATLTQPAAASTSATLMKAEGLKVASYEVATVRLDELPLSGRRILIKLDLQGAEPAALEGLGACWERVAGVLLEVSYGPDGSSRQLAAELVRHGFHEAATFNELDEGGIAVEADKLWLTSEGDETPNEPGQ